MLGENKIVSVATMGLDDGELSYLSEAIVDAIDVLNDWEQQRWIDFEFYCRYGYFLAGN